MELVVKGGACGGSSEWMGVWREGRVEGVVMGVVNGGTCGGSSEWRGVWRE